MASLVLISWVVLSFSNYFEYTAGLHYLNFKCMKRVKITKRKKETDSFFSPHFCTSSSQIVKFKRKIGTKLRNWSLVYTKNIRDKIIRKYGIEVWKFDLCSSYAHETWVYCFMTPYE